jgi:two-component system NtrC family sensor kinase
MVPVLPPNFWPGCKGYPTFLIDRLAALSYTNETAKTVLLKLNLAQPQRQARRPVEVEIITVPIRQPVETNSGVKEQRPQPKSIFLKRASNMLNTIRGRIIIVLILGLTLLLVITAMNFWSVFSVNKKLQIIENYDDLFNNMLEVRRYEKNFILYKDVSNLKESLEYLDKAEDLADKLSVNISEIVGTKAFHRFISVLHSYRQIIVKYTASNNDQISQADISLMRSRGKQLIESVSKFIDTKRQRIHRALYHSLLIPFLVLLIFLAVIILTFRIVVRDIFLPLQLIELTTREIARGNFAAIDYEARRKDEIYDLVTAFNKMAREIDERQEELVQSRKIAALGTFTAGVAHEINNPLNNISLTAEALIEDFGPEIPGEAKELVLDILFQSERAADVVGNLLDFSRSERSSSEELSVEDVIKRTIKLVKNQMMLSGIQPTVTIAPTIPQIRGTLRHLQQVFLNLFLNAIHAMPDGGKLRVKARPYSDEFIRIAVKDTGVGIKTDDLEKIFDPFYTTKGVGRGTGLGLSVTYAIVKDHGGYIEVESEVGKGSTFFVYLPIWKEGIKLEDGRSPSDS